MSLADEIATAAGSSTASPAAAQASLADQIASAAGTGGQVMGRNGKMWTPPPPMVVDPTDGMSIPEKLLAGTGMGMARVIRAVTPGGWSAAMGLPSSKEEAGKLDAPLSSTIAGKIGNVVGGAALAAPAMFIPGANTYLGAGAIGAGVGALTTEGGIQDRLQGAALGGVGGVVGKGLGDAIGAGATLLKNLITTKAASQQAANAARDVAAQTARANGYVLPPQEVNPGLINSALEGLSGKVKTSQAASQTNQAATNNLVRSALGLPADAPLTMDTLNAVRQQAGQAYQAVRNSGTVTPGQPYFDALDKISNQANGAAKSFPGLKNDNVGTVLDTLRQPQFEAGDAIDAIGSLRDLAGKAYASGSKSEGAAYKQSAAALEDALDEHLQVNGSPDALQNFRDARQTIAKTYSVQGALNPTTGNVSAAKLATQLQKGKPLSGDLQTIGTVGSAFPKATQTLSQNYNPVSPLDYLAALGTGGAGYVASHGVSGLSAAAIPLLRPAVRSVILSKPVQGLNAMLGNNYSTPLSDLLPALNTKTTRSLLQLGGAEEGIEQAQQ